MTMLVLRLVLSLAFIAGVLAVAIRVSRARQAAGSGGALEILARQSVTRTTSVALIRVGDRAFAIGTGESHVTLLGEIDPDSVSEYQSSDASAASPSAPSGGTGALAGSVFDRSQWSAVMDTLRKATVRR